MNSADTFTGSGWCRQVCISLAFFLDYLGNFNAPLSTCSIPIFTSKLEKAREATDLANMRSAKAAAVAMYLDNTSGSAGDYYYDANGGVLTKDSTGIKGYGKGTTLQGDASMDSQFGYDYTKPNEGNIIKVNLTSEGAIEMSWVAAK